MAFFLPTQMRANRSKLLRFELILPRVMRVMKL